MNVSVGFVSDGGCVPEFCHSLAVLSSRQSEKYQLNAILLEKGALIDDNRNRLVQRFLFETPSDWLLMLDTDLSFEDTVVEQLLEMSAETGAKICAGWYNVRINNQGYTIPVPTVQYFLPDDVSRVHLFSDGDPQYLKVDGVASGLLMVHREVYEKTGPYHFKVGHSKGSTQTEDVHFCKTVAGLGYPIYVHRDVRALHYKVIPI